MKSAVLFLVFNRPDTTRQVFAAIRAARPPRLYVAADGPRLNRAGEVERCREVRTIATAVDWPCKVKTLLRNENLGCKRGVSEGINWFFENEEEGIILEDDVLPLPTFFSYCDELLARYRFEPKIGVISGCNLISDSISLDESYFFSRYNHVWGWASWRRAWADYDVSIVSWHEWRDKGGLSNISQGNALFERYWTSIFNQVFDGMIDTWDYQWTLHCWQQNMLTALPAKNQTFNLGFGVDASHTVGNAPTFVKKTIPEALIFPLYHPTEIQRREVFDKVIDQKIFGITWVNHLKRLAKVILKN